MSYAQYMAMQTSTPVIQPERYAEAEQKAIKKLFNSIPRDWAVLDVGCASGNGLKYLRSLGYTNLMGIELDERKAKAQDIPYEHIVVADIMDFQPAYERLFDVIYSSHSMEHFYDVEKAIINLKKITSDRVVFLVILPYPDLIPSPAHCAAPVLGTNINDNGESVRRWFVLHGFVIDDYQFDNYREPEIWLTMRKL